jgi:hypothetical protein
METEAKAPAVGPISKARAVPRRCTADTEVRSVTRAAEPGKQQRADHHSEHSRHHHADKSDVLLIGRMSKHSSKRFLDRGLESLKLRRQSLLNGRRIKCFEISDAQFQLFDFRVSSARLSDWPIVVEEGRYGGFPRAGILAFDKKPLSHTRQRLRNRAVMHSATRERL